MNAQYEDLMRKVAAAVVRVQQEMNEGGNGAIPLGISNRHIHLSQEDLEKLFGPGYQLTNTKDLVQPGQFACKETLTVCGPKGAIEKVRVLGPVRKQTQVEILTGDTYKLGVKGEVRMSGVLGGTPGVTLTGPKGSVQIPEGVMIAQRHIHMSCEDAARFGVTDGEIVDLECEGTRSGLLHDVVIRANNNSRLECHLDTEEANALGLTSKSNVRIVKKA